MHEMWHDCFGSFQAELNSLFVEIVHFKYRIKDSTFKEAASQFGRWPRILQTFLLIPAT